MTIGRKLAIAGCVIAGVMGYMAYLGASSSWQYYVTVDECLTDAARLAGRPGTREREDCARIARNHQDRRGANFALEGTAGKLMVNCAGPLPDNLAEGAEVVVEGRLDAAGTLRGEKLLTRCASKYKAQVASDDPRSSPRGSSEGP